MQRRELLHVSCGGLLGLSLPRLFDIEARAAQTASAAGHSPSTPRARSAIMLFLSGGPSQLDTFDLKPDAPAEVRGDFQPIVTSVPGIQICEHLPRMARVADRTTILRAVAHDNPDHPSAAYWMMVGSRIARPQPTAAYMSRQDRPHPGGALAHVLGQTPAMPSWVMIPEAIQPNGPERAGQHGGFLGAAYDPYRINSDPNEPDYTPGAIAPLEGLPQERIGQRQTLRAALEPLAPLPLAGNELSTSYTRAFDLLTSPTTSRALDVSQESAATRDRYGRHVFGQSVLVARRLVEAGVRLVHVNWVRHDKGKGGQGFDTHQDHLNWSKQELLPPTDAAFASLVEDLDERGLLDETLVVMFGEFGRTPRFNKQGGRDHWPYCFSAVMAGGGLRGGQVLGRSDRMGAHPAEGRTTPDDIIATLYHLLGAAPHTPIYDQQQRPFPLSEGRVLAELL